MNSGKNFKLYHHYEGDKLERVLFRITDQNGHTLGKIEFMKKDKEILLDIAERIKEIANKF